MTVALANIGAGSGATADFSAGDLRRARSRCNRWCIKVVHDNIQVVH